MDKNQFNDTDDTREKVSSTRSQRLRRKRKESKSEEYPIKQNPWSDSDEGKSSSCSESTKTSDSW